LIDYYIPYNTSTLNSSYRIVGYLASKSVLKLGFIIDDQISSLSKSCYSHIRSWAPLYPSLPWF